MNDPGLRTRCLLLIACVIAGCAQEQVPVPAAAAVAAAQTGCLPDGSGILKATVRGALEAQLDWSNAQMECDGDLRPDGRGLRVVIVGPLQESASTALDPARTPGIARKLRIIFGIDLEDAAEGPAQVLPTNLTLIVDGESLLYATRGAELCAVEDLARLPLDGGGGIERVTVRGYCLGPASDIAGTQRVHMPTFSFTALIRREAAVVTAVP
jgi:hypothetical protein